MSKLLKIIQNKRERESLLRQEFWKQMQDKINLDFLRFLQQSFKEGFLHTIAKYNKEATSIVYFVDEKDKMFNKIIETIIQDFLKEIVRIITKDILCDGLNDIYKPGQIYNAVTDYPYIMHFMIAKVKQSTSDVYYCTISERKGQFINIKLVLNQESALFHIESDDPDVYFSEVPIELSLIN